MKLSHITCLLALGLLADSQFHEETVTSGLEQITASIGTEGDPWARENFEIQQLLDPSTGKIPDKIRQRELQFAREHEDDQRARFSGVGTDWEFAGPMNVGGRTRGAAFDVSDPTGNTLLAGGVSGGIWKTTNGGDSWTRTSDPELRNSVTSLEQDRRVGKENVWYFGTGELGIGASARSVGAPFRGDGLFKSVDSGESWTQISSTQDSDPTRFGSQFQYIWRIVTDHTDLVNDVLLVAAYGGILRTVDGGDSWTVVLGEELINLPEETDLNGSVAPLYTEVVINDQGHYYAWLSDQTLSEEIYGPAGIYWSEDGISWFRIMATSATTTGSLGRMVIDSRGNEAYFFAAQNDLSKLFHYELMDSPDDRPIGTISELTENLPDFEELGGLDIQGGYNMTIKISPFDENLIVLGGTNLYRSTNGFGTGNGNEWIGGYSKENDASLYENHHPDMHEILFHPSSSNALVSVSDGGLHFTNDIYADEVAWTPLNNGYVTSQFYTVHVRKEENDETIVGGLQDNGTFVTQTEDETADWIQVLGGDGSYCATVPFGLYWYFSFQNGRIYRLTFGENNSSFARVDPEPGPSLTLSEYLFINPFVLDPQNPNVMYLAAGDAVWRNSNLAQIPSGSNDRTTVNWELLEETEQDSALISAIEVTWNSEFVFYGTGSGELYRLSDLFDQMQTEKMHDFGDGRYITSISSSPDDDSEIIVTLSNYGIQSIFHSDDGGETFTNVSGDLEEFADGSGNGPSARWAEIVPLFDGTSRYFVGTSVGPYSTDVLDGPSTIWQKEGTETIGKSVVRMMDYRPLDGTFVVATHGNGIFRTKILDRKTIAASEANIPDQFANSSGYPNPFSDLINIDFDIPETQFLKVDIFDMRGNHVRNLFLGPQFAGKSKVTWDGKDQHGAFVKDGMYIYRIYYDGIIKGGRIVYNR